MTLDEFLTELAQMPAFGHTLVAVSVLGGRREVSGVDYSHQGVIIETGAGVTERERAEYASRQREWAGQCAATLLELIDQLLTATPTPSVSQLHALRTAVLARASLPRRLVELSRWEKTQIH